ncbi:MAG: beta-lactamase family protein [Acidobacteria bacterium]|nr:beta-lactamase family protein [Acidobacteriota bacterium]
MSLRVVLLALCLTAACASPMPPPAAEVTPDSLDAFRAEAAAILQRHGVPGAGIALVRANGVEWAGGVGVADREANTPVTADTHFRVGSISKTFVAMALVQQYLDDRVDLEDPVSLHVNDIVIDNAYNGTPVTILHLLQHTAGFDDMHFNETYNLSDPPDLPLVDVLRRNPASRRVRWRPGTRMSYSNPGYAVAALVLERVTGRSYEDVIRDGIFLPLGMTTSSFTLAEGDLQGMARGYDSREGSPVPFSQIYLRPAGNLHTSAAELGRFVQMLLNWGETNDHLVVDPEYLSNMERPRTSIAARAGLIYGYGTGIASRSLAGFPVLGHNGGIDGFVSSYGYSAARDVGWVVLLNATYAPRALDEVSALALRYLKRDVEPPSRPEEIVPPEELSALHGYYHQQGTRNAILDGAEWLTSGVTVTTTGNRVVMTPVTGSREAWIPVSPTLVRRERDVTPSRVFTTDEDGRGVIAGDGVFLRRTPRWRIEIVRVPVLLSLLVIVTLPLAVITWIVRIWTSRASLYWALKIALALLPLSLLAAASMLLWAPMREWGVPGWWSRLTYVGTVAFPLASIVAAALTVDAWRRGIAGWLRTYVIVVVVAGLIVSAYMAASGWIAVRAWLL